METNTVGNTPAPANVSNKFGNLSLACSLAAVAIVLLAWFAHIPSNSLLTIIAYLLGSLLGIVFYFKQKKIKVTITATIGVIIGSIGIFLGIIMFLILAGWSMV